jgi:hypothetical protein
LQSNLSDAIIEAVCHKQQKAESETLEEMGEKMHRVSATEMPPMTAVSIPDVGLMLAVRDTEREIQRERHRGRDTERETERERETQRERDRERERERHRERDRERERERQRERAFSRMQQQ